MPVVDTTRTFTNNEQITSTKLNEIMDNSSFVSGAVVTSGGLEITAGGQMQIATSGVTTTKIANLNVTTEKIADGAVTQAKASNMLLPSGAVMAFAMNAAPTGWLAANGAAVSRSTYADLFAAIGTAHGAGDGSTTFNLPDLRGIFVSGSGTQTVGAGVYTRTFAAKQQDAIQNITGRVATFANGSLGGNWHVEPQNATGPFYNTSSGGSMTTGGGGAGAGYVNVDFDASRVVRTSTETIPVNIALLYCIKI